MLWLSEILLQNPNTESFAELLTLVKAGARRGELFFRIDIKPPYTDTPPNWEDQLEAAFSGVIEH